MYLFYNQETEVKARVTLMYYTELPAELLSQPHISIESIPEPENRIGKSNIPYINPQTREFWYEYIDRPLTDAEKLSQLQAENAQINYALMMGGLV